MIDILILALPADRKPAESVLDALHEARIAGPFRTRLLTDGPLDAGWSEEVRLAEASACVIFCWSAATAADDAEPFRMLGARMLAARRAISVILAPGALPAEMAGSSSYPLHGWRGRPKGWVRFVFGNGYLTQIAAAAARKASGQDPPPPQAFWLLVRGRAWAALLGVMAVLGALSMLWGLYNDNALARMLDPAGGQAVAELRQRKSCAAVRDFLAKRGDSAWAGPARDLLSRCHKVTKVAWRTRDQSFPAFGTSRVEAEADARRLCAGFARNSGGKLLSATLTDFVAGRQATALCRLTMPIAEEREVME